MSTDMTTADSPKKPAREDWHSAYIVYRLRLKGLSLRRLARLHGYDPTAAELATRRPWPKMERLISEALGVTPQQIWPSRYYADGRPRSGRGERGIGRYKPKHTSVGGGGNVHVEKAS